jgi:hypothetical protein
MYRRSICLLLMFVSLLVTLSIAETADPAGKGVSNFEPAVAAFAASASSGIRNSNSADAFDTAYNYVVTFYPRWFTFMQSALGPANRLLGPDRISPLYHTVVAINDDTLYASTFLSVTPDDPVVVTMPSTTDNYSVLQLDQYGDVFTGIPGNQPGVYALYVQGWNGTCPNGFKACIQIPYQNSVLIVRADKYVNNVDMRQQADQFRRGIHIAPLSVYMSNPQSGPTQIVPELVFAVPYKAIAVNMIATEPLSFLFLLQASVLSLNTDPLTPDEQTLSDAFNTLFSDPTNYPQMTAATQVAHAAIDSDYLNKTLAGTSWIHFTNIGTWLNPPAYLDRSAVTDYIQYGNNITAAGYYHTFNDSNGHPLDGSAHIYILRFASNQIPQVTRFWSVTAYLPLGIELVPNSANKYVVASYTPGLIKGNDGSVSILMSVNPPSGFPLANWLPIPPGPFNIMLRAYGPGKDIQNNDYVPPPILTLAVRP